MEEGKARKEKQKKAKEEFAAFLKYLKKICATLHELDQWQKIISDLKNLAQAHGEAFTGKRLEKDWKKLQEFISTYENLTILDQAKKACASMQDVLAMVKSHWPGHGIAYYIGSCAGGLIGVTAISVIAVCATVTVNGTVPVIIRNNGCAPIPPPRSAVVQLLEFLPGTNFPREEIPTGGESMARVPAFTVTIRASDRMVAARALGVVPIEFALPEAIHDIEFNGVPLRPIDSTIDLGAQSSHELVIICR